MKKKNQNQQSKSCEKKVLRPWFANTSSTVDDFIFRANEELHDVLFVPHLKDVRNCYSWDFVLMTKWDAKKIVKQQKNITFKNSITAKLFLYNERFKWVVPFQKNDYLMYDDGYMRCDGDICYYYDNFGKEIGTNTLCDENEMIDQDEQLIA